jgi:hypothetical protein
MFCCFVGVVLYRTPLICFSNGLLLLFSDVIRFLPWPLIEVNQMKRYIILIAGMSYKNIDKNFHTCTLTFANCPISHEALVTCAHRSPRNIIARRIFITCTVIRAFYELCNENDTKLSNSNSYKVAS